MPPSVWREGEREKEEEKEGVKCQQRFDEQKKSYTILGKKGKRKIFHQKSNCPNRKKGGYIAVQMSNSQASTCAMQIISTGPTPAEQHLSAVCGTTAARSNHSSLLPDPTLRLLPSPTQ